MAERQDDEDMARASLSARREEERAQLPAIYVDTWATLTWYRHIRLVMAESFATGSRPRAAFVMPLDKAEEFADFLVETIKERKAKDKKIDEADG